MKPEIEELIEIYENREKYQKRAAAKAQLIPDLVEILNAHEKITFDKRRQRAELLKLNEVFLKELSAIKNRLGEKFFKLLDTEIPRAAVGSPGSYFRPRPIGPYGDINTSGPETLYGMFQDAISKSNFAEPKIIFEKEVWPDDSEFPVTVQFLPGTRIEGDGWPESEVEGKDPFFNSPPLEWVFVTYGDLEIEDSYFLLRCKEEVLFNYISKWNEFLTKWHISTEWNGDLQYLHIHALPSLIVGRDLANHNLPVVIRLGAWANSDDLKHAWPRVEELLKEARVFQERDSDDELFNRDLIWYRLNKDEAFSPFKIAQFWAKKRPHEIDLEVIEKVMRDEEAFDGVPPKECLEEVLSNDPKMDELRGRFIEARKAFIRTGLADKVKKSIKKTKDKIARNSSEEWEHNRERLLKPAR